MRKVTYPNIGFRLCGLRMRLEGKPFIQCNPNVAIEFHLMNRAKKDGKIYDEISLNYIVNEICSFRAKLQELMCYDWVCIPIVYTQVC